MRDTEFVARQTISERKNIARQANAKKNGSRSKRCSLPSDNMAKSEWKKRNGEMITVKLNEKMEYRMFKSLPDSLQAEYLNNLVDKYEARQKDIAEMFGISTSMISLHFQTLLPGKKLSYKYTVSPKWLDFINGKKEEPKSEAAVQEELAEEIPIVQDIPEEEAKIKVEYGNINLSGKAHAVFAKALPLFDENVEYTITISFKEKGNC